MIIVGEKINASRKPIAAALEQKDEAAIIEVARQQADAGAHYLDINGGHPDREIEADHIAWLVDVVQKAVDLPLMIDTTCPEAAAAGLARVRKRAVLNSVSLEGERLKALMPIIREFDCDVVALTMSDDAPPRDVHDRLKAANELIELLLDTDREPDQLYVDPCFFPVASQPGSARALMESIAALRTEWPDVHIIGGVSNISYGLPARHNVNLAALAQAIYHGLDAAIIDPTAPAMMGIVYASQTLSGQDEFCLDYVNAQRAGQMQPG